MKLLRAFAALIVAGCASSSARAELPAPVTVSAAASLTEALTEIGAAYEKRTKQPVRFNFAASGVLAKQIEAGAPADLFISADEQWMDYASANKLIDPETVTVLARNSLVLVAPRDSKATLKIAPNFPIEAAIGNGRLALGDPASVPAGKYGKAALSSLGVWERVRTKVAIADNVRAALALVSRGEAPLGIVYATDARIDPGVKVVGVFPESSHRPIVYPAALTARKSPAAAAFLRALQNGEARAILGKHGFLTHR